MLGSVSAAAIRRTKALYINSSTEAIDLILSINTIVFGILIGDALLLLATYLRINAKASYFEVRPFRIRRIQRDISV